MPLSSVRLADAQHLSGPPVAATQHRLEPSPQLGIGERLGEHVVRAALECPHPRELVGPAAQHEQRHVRVDPVPQPAGAPNRVEQPQGLPVEIGEDQVRPPVGQQRQRLVARLGGCHLIAVLGQVVGQEGAAGRVLVYDQRIV